MLEPVIPSRSSGGQQDAMGRFDAIQLGAALSPTEISVAIFSRSVCKFLSFTTESGSADVFTESPTIDSHEMFQLVSFPNSEKHLPALSFAAQQGLVEVASLLLQSGVPVDECISAGRPPDDVPRNQQVDSNDNECHVRVFIFSIWDWCCLGSMC